jgi:hypothetical protein
MEREMNNGLMELTMKEISQTVRKKVTENLALQMDQSMKENSIKMRLAEWALINGMTERFT